MLLADLIRDASHSLEGLYPPEEARSIALRLCGSRLGVCSWTHITEPGREVASDDESTLRSDLSRLLSGEPLQYVLGTASFFGREFHVSPAVLIPRPETELLIDSLLGTQLPGGSVRASRSSHHFASLVVPPLTCPRVDTPPARDWVPSRENVRILDLCTGSGCIAWTLAAEINGAEVDAVDISEEALKVAREQRIECAVNPRFLKADVLGDVPDSLNGPYDLIVSNPPYVMEGERAAMHRNVLNHEPALALFVPDDDPLIFYRAIARWSSTLLAPGGFGIVEINELLGRETAAVFSDAGFHQVEVLRDLSGKDRFVRFRLL